MARPMLRFEQRRWWTDRVYFLAFSLAGPVAPLTARLTSTTPEGDVVAVTVPMGKLRLPRLAAVGKRLLRLLLKRARRLGEVLSPPRSRPGRGSKGDPPTPWPPHETIGRAG